MGFYVVFKNRNVFVKSHFSFSKINNEVNLRTATSGLQGEGILGAVVFRQDISKEKGE